MRTFHCYGKVHSLKNDFPKLCEPGTAEGRSYNLGTHFYIPCNCTKKGIGIEEPEREGDPRMGNPSATHGAPRPTYMGDAVLLAIRTRPLCACALQCAGTDPCDFSDGFTQLTKSKVNCAFREFRARQNYLLIERFRRR